MDRASLIRTVWPSKYQSSDPEPYGKIKPYQANFCADVEARFGFQGKRVLEVGGSLNRTFVLDDLKVKSWTAIQEPLYWASIGRKFDDIATVDYPSFEAADPEKLGPYQIITAPIERLPEKFYDSFDIAISMAAFTFVQQVGPALDKIYRALSPGGAFGMMAAQIWSSETGLFYHTVTDKMGRMISPYPIEGHINLVPKWAHLTMTGPELYDYLCRYTDSEAAGDIVFELFSSRRINRCFAEDYKKYFEVSPFQRYGKVETNIAQQNLPDAALQKMLEARHPGRRDFNTGFITAFCQRLA